jgi:hypothetical protein
MSTLRTPPGPPTNTLPTANMQSFGFVLLLRPFVVPNALIMHFRSLQSYGEIFAMREDGTRLRQLTEDQWEESADTWLPQVR